MTAVQRYGELRLDVRLTKNIDETVGYQLPCSSTHISLALKKSYGERRLEDSTMSAEHEATSTAKEEATTSELGMDNDEPASKRVCGDAGLRNATKMTKVEVGGGKDGPPEAEWLIHETLLVAHSELAKGCLKHDTAEVSTSTIKMEEADAEPFGVFVDYLYKERLESAKLDIDQLIAVYMLADYVACPKLANLVLQQIHLRTHNATFTYSAKQIDHILSNTLASQPLHTRLLNQVGRGVLLKKYNFAPFSEDRQVIEPHMPDLLDAVVQAVAATAVTVSPEFFVASIYPAVIHYLKHGPARVENETEAFNQTTNSEVDSSEAEIGRICVGNVAKQANVSRQAAINALLANGCKMGATIHSLKRG